MKKKFDFSETPVAKVSDDIRDNNQHDAVAPVTPIATAPVQEAISQAQTAIPIVEPIQASAPAQPLSPVQTVPPANIKAKKATNGIVIDVPMEEYIQLTMMKVQTGRTLKDLALQAIREFVQRNNGAG